MRKELINQYLNTGIAIGENQLKKLNKSQLATWGRSRVNTVLNTWDKIELYEYKYIQDADLKKYFTQTENLLDSRDMGHLEVDKRLKKFIPTYIDNYLKLIDYSTDRVANPGINHEMWHFLNDEQKKRFIDNMDLVEDELEEEILDNFPIEIKSYFINKILNYKTTQYGRYALLPIELTEMLFDELSPETQVKVMQYHFEHEVHFDTKTKNLINIFNKLDDKQKEKLLSDLYGYLSVRDSKDDDINPFIDNIFDLYKKFGDKGTINRMRFQELIGYSLFNHPDYSAKQLKKLNDKELSIIFDNIDNYIDPEQLNGDLLKMYKNYKQ